MTRDEAIARLLAVPALPRGERLAWALSLPMIRRIQPRWWWRMFANISRIHLIVNGVNIDDATLVSRWRRLAAPLRRAREERRRLKGLLFKAWADEQDASGRIRALELELSIARSAAPPAYFERIKQLEGALADLCGAADELHEAKISAGEFDDTLHDARAALAGGGK
jgi:hypothetical protein